MNIHPIFVHFPIALLTVYTLLEFLRFKKLNAKSWYFYLKLFLVSAGIVGAYLAVKTGELAFKLFPSGAESKLLKTHAFWGKTSLTIFSVIAAAYVIRWVKDYSGQIIFASRILSASPVKKIWRIVIVISDFVMSPYLLTLLAVLGFLAILITSALGGSIVYGPEIDPMANFFYKLFVE